MKNSVVAQCLDARKGVRLGFLGGQWHPSQRNFRISHMTSFHLFKEYGSQIALGECMDLLQRCKERCGHRTSILDDDVWDVPLVHPISFRKWAAKVGFSLSSLWDIWKREKVKKVKR
ncbi:unnamed protein product [Choristocarpus tenellus]